MARKVICKIFAKNIIIEISEDYVHPN